MRTALLGLAIFVAQDTKPSERPELEGLSGDVRVWRAEKKQVEKVDRPFKVEPSDRIGSE